ncbi:hypothetical protein, partial [Escherichia coli]
ILLRQKQKKLIMLPSETMIWQPEFTDKTLSRKPGAVHSAVALFQGNFATAIKSSTFCFCHSIETLRFNRYTCYLQL